MGTSYRAQAPQDDTFTFRSVKGGFRMPDTVTEIRPMSEEEIRSRLDRLAGQRARPVEEDETSAVRARQEHLLEGTRASERPAPIRPRLPSEPTIPAMARAPMATIPQSPSDAPSVWLPLPALPTPQSGKRSSRKLSTFARVALVVVSAAAVVGGGVLAARHLEGAARAQSVPASAPAAAAPAAAAAREVAPSSPALAAAPVEARAPEAEPVIVIRAPQAPAAEPVVVTPPAPEAKRVVKAAAPPAPNPTPRAARAEAAPAPAPPPAPAAPTTGDPDLERAARTAARANAQLDSALR